MDEFELIDRIVAKLGPATTASNVILGPGDDCAELDIPAGCNLVSSIDTLVEGRHFPAHAGGDLVGYRAMVVNLSDLAAMGASPSHALIAMTLPEIEEVWIDAFCEGVLAACTQFECPLVGGNIARGPLSISVSVHGLVANKTSLTRSGAAAGDLLCTTGQLGGACMALEHPRFNELWTLGQLQNMQVDSDCLPIKRYYMPQPRLSFARNLVGVASAAIDISDGLMADARHLARASGVGLAIQLQNISCFAGCTVEQAAVAGDDYELCFTVPEQKLELAEKAANDQGLAMQVIGSVVDGDEVALYLGKDRVSPDSAGYQHFQTSR